MKEFNFKADARETIKRMKWNNSLKRKLKTENCDNDTVTLTTEEVIEFLESVYQMFVKIRAKPTIITEKNLSTITRCDVKDQSRSFEVLQNNMQGGETKTVSETKSPDPPFTHVDFNYINTESKLVNTESKNTDDFDV
nr:hypothetical protein [Pieris rapae granulovirus]